MMDIYAMGPKELGLHPCSTEGSCKYHGGKLGGAGWEYKYSCCNKSTRNYERAKTLPGCTKGKHRSKHHMDYPYAAYNFYMHALVSRVG